MKSRLVLLDPNAKPVSYWDQVKANEPRTDNTTAFNDDEPVEVHDFKNHPKGSKNISYDLEAGLSVEIKSMHKYFNFNDSKEQTIPVMVSLKTKESA